ncbi:MAG: hypothetical protein KGL57_06260 [Burkholderiales bacterium]|nr:hypothetical protein [Burkholderiales bacterium]
MTLMLAMALAAMVGLIAWGPVVLVSHMHHFADRRTWHGIPNAVNVWSHLPLIPIGIWGLWRVSCLPATERLRGIWFWFFVCQLLATLGGMVYHWAPSDTSFIWDQVPKSAASTLFALAFLAERADRRLGHANAIATGLIASLLGGIWWLYTLGLDGVGDLRPLMWLEMMPVLLVATGAWTLNGHLLTRHDWMRSQLSFVLAQALDWGDRWFFEATGQAISGHSLRHLALAACCGWVAYRLGGPVRLRSGDSVPRGGKDLSASPLSELAS